MPMSRSSKEVYVKAEKRLRWTNRTTNPQINGTTDRRTHRRRPYRIPVLTNIKDGHRRPQGGVMGQLHPPGRCKIQMRFDYDILVRTKKDPNITTGHVRFTGSK